MCPSCDYIDYVNPVNVVGTVPVWDDGTGQLKILLCRRAIEPRLGFWTLPAGFLEVGETCEDGAWRETWEESGAQVEMQGLYAVLDVVQAAQVHLFYRARIVEANGLQPGPETLENRFVTVEEIPWDEIAFSSVRWVLQAWVRDAKRGSFGVHAETITWELLSGPHPDAAES